MTELEQFTLDPLIPPAAVVPCEALHQRDGFGADRRPTCARRVSPVPGHQAPVSVQEGGWGDQVMGAQFAGQQPDERGEHGMISPGRPRLGSDSAKQGNLGAQDEQLDISSTPRTGQTATASRQPARRSGKADATTRRTIIMIARSTRSPRSPMRQTSGTPLASVAITRKIVHARPSVSRDNPAGRRSGSGGAVSPSS